MIKDSEDECSCVLSVENILPVFKSQEQMAKLIFYNTTHQHKQEGKVLNGL